MILQTTRHQLRHLVRLFLALFLPFIVTFTVVEHSVASRHHSLIQLPSQNANFIGRQQQLADIKENLHSHKTPLAIVGLSGIGKSQIAKEYAYRYRGSYGVIWWFDAAGDLAQQFMDFAHAWNNYHQHDPSLCILPHAISPQGVAKAITQALQNTKKKWLLVFDNSKSIISMENYLPNISTASDHHVILTSKFTNDWPQKMKITPLQRDESLALIANLLPEITPKEKENLASTLGDFPLAIVQAATCINRVPSMKVENYIQLFKQKNGMLKKLEGDIGVEADAYKQTLTTALSLSLQELQKASPIAYEALKYFSFLNNKGITEPLISKWLELKNYPPETLHEITFRLTAFAFLEETHDEQKHLKQQQAKMYEMHELVQQVARDNLSTKDLQKILLLMARLMASFVFGETNDLLKITEQYPELYQHSKALCHHLESNPSPTPEEIEFQIDIVHLATYYRYEADYARRLGEIIKNNINTKPTISDFSYARYLSTMGHLTFPRDITLAIKWTKQANQLLEPLDSRQAKSELFFSLVNNLTDYYLIQGRLMDATEACKKGESIAKELNNKTYNAFYYSFMSLCFMCKGQYAQALENIELALKNIEEGKLSKQFLFAEINLLEILVRSGKLAEAQDLLPALEKKADEIFPSSFQYLPVRIQFLKSSLLFQQEKYSLAKQNIERAIKKWDQELNIDGGDPIQAYSHIVLGAIYEQENNFTKACQEYQLAETIFDNVSSVKEYDDISDIYSRLALLGVKMERHGLTREYLLKQITHFGVNHPRTKMIIKHLDQLDIPLPL